MGKTGLTNYDASWVVQRMPKPVRGMLKFWGTRLVIAGGFIRGCIANEQTSDIDVFSINKEEAQKAAKHLSGEKELYETDNAYTVKLEGGYPVQFIHRWTFEEPEKLVESFDFTIARAAIWWDRSKHCWRTLADDRFYQDLAAKRLVYCSPVRNEDAGGSLLRVLKFYQRGYRIPLDSMGAVLARLYEAVDETKLPDGGSEAGVAKVLTGLLREVDPSIDPSHLAHLPGMNEGSNECDPECTTGA